MKGGPMDGERMQIAGLTVAVMVAVAALYDKVLPPAHELHEQAPTPALTGRVRSTCLTTAPVAVAVGAGAAVLAKSWWPLWGTLGVVAWMWWQYDTAAAAGSVPAGTVPPVTKGGRYA